jgi:hypothetical protein
MVKEPAFHEVPLNYDTCVKNSDFYGIPYKYLHRQKSISEVAVSSEKTRIQSPKNSEDSNDEKSSDDQVENSKVRNFGESLEESKLKNEFQKIGNKINPNAKEKVEDEDDTKFKNPHEVPIGMLVVHGVLILPIFIKPPKIINILENIFKKIFLENNYEKFRIL